VRKSFQLLATLSRWRSLRNPLLPATTRCWSWQCLGIRYLRALQERFGQLDLALAAYNVGPTRLGRALQDGELDSLRRYAKLVRRVFRRFREGEGLEGDWALAQRDSVRGKVR
jgi:hypothetical protein